MTTTTSSNLDRYRRHLRAQGFATNTVREKADAVRRVAELAGIEPEHLTVDHVEAYLGERELAAWSRRKYLEHVRAYAAWAGIDDPTARLKRPPQPRAVPKPASEADLQALLAVADDVARAYILLGAYAGLRSFETARVAGADIETTSAGPALRVRGKGGRTDVQPIPAVLAAELSAWRRRVGEGRFWPEATARQVQSLIRKTSETAGVSVSSHQLRHRYGTMVHAAGRDLLVTQRLMRHASPNTTIGYAQLVDDVGARLVDLLPVPVPQSQQQLRAV